VFYYLAVDKLLSALHCRFGIAIYHSAGLIHAHAGGRFGIAFESNHVAVWFQGL
jgi:hypothetical protein